MPYIGQQPTSVAFLTDQFNGNGSTTAFTLSAAPANTSSVLVAVSGVLQDPSTYSVSGTTLTFSAAPPTGTGNISVRFLGIPASGVTTTAYRTVTEFTATASQTTFSVPSYTVGFIDVYRNGVMLGSADYTATNGTTVVLSTGATSGDLIEIISFQVSSVLNAIPASPSSVGTSYLVDGSVTTAKIADNAITTAKIAAGAVVQADLATGVAGTGPAFSAYCSTAQVIPNAVFTKIQINTELFDTNSNFDNATQYRFTPTVAGYYQVTGGVYFSYSSGTALNAIFKNGISIFNSVWNSTSSGGLVPASGLVYMNGSTDFLELYAYQASGGNQSLVASRQDLNYFFGLLVRAA
jgi:hypothetical protein